jgi:hypothetical protein
MSTSTEGRPPNVPAWPTEARSLLRWVSTNNPFYVGSAGLFLVGLWLTFGEPDKVEDNWLLMAGLTAYTLLLGVTAIVLIRFAKVWDDARTVLLLIVLMFLATSVTLDYLIVFDKRFGNRVLPLHAIVSTFLALGVVVGVSETILRVVRLKLPLVYRVPYYLILAVFIIYPLAMTPFLDRANPRNPGIMWGLFGFSSIAGLAFLTLIPAIRQGSSATRRNGSPWPWPLYPWSLFGLLALAVPGRAILICYSMLLIDVADLYDMTFGPYFLVPFGLVLCALLLEAGLVTKRRSLILGALIAPLALVAMSMVGHRPEGVYQQFLNMFRDRFGGADPVFMSLLAVATFYTYAAIRRTPWALEALTASLAMATFVNPDTLRTGLIAAPQPAPMLVAAIVLLGLGVWRRGSWRCFAGACGLAVAFGLLITDDSVLFPYRWPMAFHLLLFAMLTIGCVFDDDLGKALRTAAPAMVLLVCLAIAILPLRPLAELPGWVPRFYPLAMALLLAAYGYLLWHPPTMVIAALILVTWSAASGWNIYRWLRTLVVGLDYLVLSFLVFALAILVSLGKSHLTARWRVPKPDEANATD